MTIPGLEEFSLGEALNLFQNDFATLAWAGTEIGEDMNLRDYVEHLLNDDEPLESFFEEEPEGRYRACTPAEFDAVACEAAVNPPAP